MSRLKKNFLYNSVLAISQILYPIITFPYVARILNPDGIGMISFVDSICKYFMLVAALGVPIYGIREVSKLKKSKDKLNTLFSELFVLHSIVSLITVLVFILIILNFEKLQSYKSLLLIGSLNIILNVFIVEWYFQGTENFKYITNRNIAIRFLSIISIFIFIKTPNDLNKYYILIMIVPVINALINFSQVYNKISIKYLVSVNELFQKHFKPLFYIFISMSFITIYTILDTIILGFLTNNKSVGLYSTAMKFAKIPIMFIGALSTVLLPRLSEYYESEKHVEFINLIEKSIKFVYFISIPIIFLVFGLAENIIHFFVGNDYHESANLLKFFSILTLLLGLSNIFGFQILTTLSKDKHFTLCVGLGTLSSVILNLIFIPSLNIYGATIANIFSEILVMFLTYYFAKKFVDFNSNIRYFFRLVLISLPTLAIIFFFKSFFQGDFLIIIVSSIFIFLYYFLIHTFILKDDIMQNINLFLKKKYERL